MLRTLIKAERKKIFQAIRNSFSSNFNTVVQKALLPMYKKQRTLSRFGLLVLGRESNKLTQSERDLIYQRSKQLLAASSKDKKLLMLCYQLELDACSFEFVKTAQKIHALSAEKRKKVVRERIDSSVYLGSLGNHHLLSSLIQGIELGYRERRKPTVYLSKLDKLRNPTLFKYFSKYLEIKSFNSNKRDCIDLPFLGLLVDIDEKMTQFEIADSFLQRKWSESGRPPLLSLTKEDNAKGEKYLQGLGIPKGAWYVCFHMREPGYRDGGSERENFRNVNPESYYEAMQEVTKQGGYVFRMGDPAMTPLRPMERVIDYAHSPERSDFLDVFLCGSCRFLVGTSSGVYNISRFFGVPILMTNMANYCNLYSLPPNSLYLPRLLREEESGKLLTLKKMLTSETNIRPSLYLYKSKGWSLVDNTEDEITHGVREMLKKGYKVNTDSSNANQALVNEISYEASSLYGGINTEIVAKMSPYFLSKYKDELLEKNNIVCHQCGQSNIKIGLMLKNQCIAHKYLKDSKAFQYQQDMVIGQCHSCGLVQLLNTFPINQLVPSYDWITCTEPEAHLDGLVSTLSALPGIDEQSEISGLTFKEQSTLDRFNCKGFTKTRILDPELDFSIFDPCSKIELVQHRFNSTSSNKIVKKYRKADVFIARHILEHAYSLNEFVNASLDLVRDDGYVVFEIPDCETGLNNGDPTILWEEHTIYFTEKTFKFFLNTLDYPVVHFKRVKYKYEDAFVAVLQKSPLKQEATIKLENEFQRFDNFSDKLHKNKKNIALFLEGERNMGKKIGVIGAGHMANAFINGYSLGKYVDYIIDDNPNMLGLYMPGCNKKIVSSDVIGTLSVDILLSTLSEQGEAKVRSRLEDKLQEIEFMSIYSQDENSIYNALKRKVCVQQ